MSNSDTDLFNQLDAEIEDLTDQMTLLEHLDEMRRRVTVVGIAILVTTLFSLIFAPQLVEFLARPLDVPIFNDQGEVIGVTSGVEILQSIEVTENIGVFMRVSFLGGLILAMPVIFYQLIAFIVPGLTDKEKKFIMLAIPAATSPARNHSPNRHCRASWIFTISPSSISNSRESSSSSPPKTIPRLRARLQLGPIWVPAVIAMACCSNS